MCDFEGFFLLEFVSNEGSCLPDVALFRRPVLKKPAILPLPTPIL